jgi:hypothetical protein
VGNAGYLLISITLLTISGLAAIAYVASTPNLSIQTLGLILGFVSPTIISLLAMLRSLKNGTEIQNLSVRVDGRLEQLLQQAGLNATLVERAAGIEKATELAKRERFDKSP